MRKRFGTVIVLGLAMALFALMSSGCSLFNLGDGKVAGVVNYELPAGFLLPDGSTLPAGASLSDVLVQLGIDLAAQQMTDKWNVQAIEAGIDPVSGGATTRIVTDYGTFVLQTGALRDSIKEVWLGQTPAGTTVIWDGGSAVVPET